MEIVSGIFGDLRRRSTTGGVVVNGGGLSDSGFSQFSLNVHELERGWCLMFKERK